MDTPKGMVIDTDGKERTDTKQILIDMVKGKCALCPMGGAGDALGGYKVGCCTCVCLYVSICMFGLVCMRICVYVGCSAFL
jgi:hypothetical protein